MLYTSTVWAQILHLQCMKCRKHKLSPSHRKTELQNDTFVGEIKKKKNSITLKHTSIASWAPLHYPISSVTKPGVMFLMGWRRETAFPHSLAKHGSLRAGNDRIGKLVSVIILIMLIAAISTPAVVSQRQARLDSSHSLRIEITAFEVTNTHT